ncbi:putative RNA-directed DNA polymerase, partial [Tanacetum coccineum]
SRGIVLQLTPPCMPQHNSVSERRNQTLLDVIRSMMSLTTLPMSFWGYALESTTRILNMVSTKKVDKTPSKWHFKKKTDMDGNIHTYKTRFVAKCFTQTYVVDYEKTFLPVADIKAIRILIVMAAFYDYNIWQMDVKTAFLNGRLNKDVYMVQPGGFMNAKHPKQVCKLQRSIYGLKQASRSWNKRFYEEIKKYGFTQNIDEPCVYMRASGSIIVFLILYVDDILLMGNSIPMLQDVKSWFGKCFAMKDLGEAAYILGIKIYQDISRRLIGLSQNAYIDKILKRFKKDASKRGSLPMQPNVDLSFIMYAVRCTRPDLAFSHNLTSRYQQNSGESYWIAIKNILKCLRNTKDMFHVYGGDSSTELSVTCYTNTGWETNRDDLRSQTGYVIVMNGGAVDCKSSKQSTTTMSSTKAEYIVVSKAAIEAIWIRKFIYRLGVVPNNDQPMDIYCDNTGSITIADEPGVQNGTKHF